MKTQTIIEEQEEFETEETSQVEEQEEEETTQEVEEQESEVFDDDDEFLEDITPEELTPEKAEKRRKQLLNLIEQSEKTVEDLKDIAEANNSGGISVLKNKIKAILSNDLENDDVKALTKGTKQLESIIVVQGLMSTFAIAHNSAQKDIERYKQELDDIKCPQIPLDFDNTEDITKEGTEDAE